VNRTAYGRFEFLLNREGYRLVAGVDEVGRGPLAGPVVAAACILREGVSWKGIRDSKALSPRARKKLFWHIVAHALVGIGVACQEEVDRLNVLNASLLAMRRAVLALSVTPDFLLVDGLFGINLPVRQAPVVGADDHFSSVGAASIVAKVTRDEMMTAYHFQYPHYGFQDHKGYATRAHLAALEQYGPSPIHRRSFRPVAQSILNGSGLS